MSWEIRRSDGVAQGDNAGPLMLYWVDENETRLVATEPSFLKIFFAESILSSEEFNMFLSLFIGSRDQVDRMVYADWVEERGRPIGAAMLRQGWSRGWESN